jgi:aspartyl-tRNA(Asn)/glutamyl-tRNA(Gln) amidotransferase subunit C
MARDNTATPFDSCVRSSASDAFLHNVPRMALTPQDVSRIAHLARLALTADEERAMLAQLNGFFGIVERMGQVDTRGVEPLYTPLSALGSVALRLRDDAVTEANERERNQRSAPQVDDGLYLVPKVIE